MSSLSIRKQIKTQTILENFEDSYKLFLAGSFQNSPNYESITINSNSINYDTFILDYDTDKQLIGYKKIICYPYDTQILFSGDYVIWDSNKWLVFSVDNQFLYNVRGKIKKCNNIVKWIDSNNVTREYSCVIDNKINNSDLDQNKNIIIPQGGIIVYLQRNLITNELSINDRFLFGKQAFKINAFIDYVSTSFMSLIMQKDNIDIRDDFINQIAYNNTTDYVLTIDQSNLTQNIGYGTTLTSTVELNEEIVSKNVIWTSSDTDKVTITDLGIISLINTGSAIITCSLEDNSTIYDTINITVNSVLPSTEIIVISPDNQTVKQGQSQTYSVYAYIDGVIQTHKFTITGSGVLTPDIYYTLLTTDNGFVVTNLKAYTINDLVITCINQTTTTSKNYNIQLKGFW